MSELNVVSLFSGIGGIELGLEAAGMTTVAQVEQDPYCQQVLAHNWPEVPRHDDVRTFRDWWGSAIRPRVDVVAGGFPCQPFSTAGHQQGTGDPRWGWPWFADVVRLVRPRYVVVENVAALLADRDAFGWLLADLADYGFDAEWSVLPACALGAPHTRRRLFLVAHTDRVNGPERLGRLDPLGRKALLACTRDARAWRDRVDRSIQAASRDPRNAHGSATAMAKAAGNAVVPAVAEYVGRVIQVHHNTHPEGKP